MLNETVSNHKNEVAELDLVFISDKEVMTDSLIVAKAFGKRHDNVIRDIERVVVDIADISTHLKFEVSKYRDVTGRKLLKYNLCKDALMLLVMGYGGKKAMQIKINYINAFNAMHEYIQNITKTRQETLFEAIRENAISEAESSLAGKVLNKRKHDKPRLLNAIKRAAQDMQESIDFAFADNKRVH